MYFSTTYNVRNLVWMQDDRVATAWLNDPAVRKAIHAKEVFISSIIHVLFFLFFFFAIKYFDI